MNQDIIQGNWKTLKGKVKTEWGKLTDDAVTQINGNADVLAGQLQKAYGYSREEAERRIDEWSRKS